MSTRPGSTFFCTPATFNGDVEDPLPAALLRGAGTSLEEMPEAAELFWLSSATVSPAPILAASAATTR
jgi:hypothetical protein